MTDHPYPKERTWADCEEQLGQRERSCAAYEKVLAAQDAKMKELLSQYGSAAQRLGEAKAEIDRLREQVAVWLDCYHAEKAKHEDLIKRVREALGDE